MQGGWAQGSRKAGGALQTRSDAHDINVPGMTCLRVSFGVQLIEEAQTS